MSSKADHVFVFADQQAWGGGFNIVCKFCGQVEGWAKTKSAPVLAECNAKPSGGPCPKRPLEL